jgi:hypothetical protein
MESPFSSGVTNVIAECNYWFGQLLGLEPNFYTGNMPPGKKYGLSMPRSLANKRDVRGGYQQLTYSLDVLYLFSVPEENDIEGTVAAGMLDLDHAIASINERVSANGMMQNLRAKLPFNAVQAQRSSPPYDWEITIAGEALIDLWVYKDANGIHRRKDC